MAPKENINDDSKGKKNVLAFIKEVAKYFMDFLETDFHKRRNPKRSIQLRNNSNLLVGLNLNKYPSFNTIIWKAVTHGFNREILTSIQKGVYKTSIPQNLLDLINLLLEKVNTKQISKIIDQIAEETKKTAVLYSKEYDQALTYSVEAAEKIIQKELVLPFVSNLEKPLENLSLGDENSIYLMEEELTNVLVALIENKISEILKLLLAKEKVDVIEQLKENFELKDVKANIYSFFENFQVGDLFSELYEMDRNKSILDKQEFYLYFCDITFNNAKYPIFYVPFSINKTSDSFSIEFDSQVYLNKKALEYITQEFNKETDHHGTLQTITERIIYLAQYEENFGDLIAKVMSEIINFFDLDKQIDISNADYQVSKSFWVKISNARYIALFDKSDEALINDYEEIIKLLNSGDSILAESFNKLIDDFIYKNPLSFNSNVESEWDNTSTSERLVFNSPIPLNSEQLQILSAIKKDGCKYLIVEGPPGTGKSHTITSIAFDHILNDKSVLVLSDKKEALDVVEDKITETLNKVRFDKNFQNPILRLGKIGNTYNKILATNTIENIKTHLRAVKKDHAELDSDIKKSGNSLKEDIQAEILANAEINLQEIHELVDLEIYFGKKGFPFNVNEALKNKNAANELEELRSLLLKLKSKLIPYDFGLNPQFKPSQPYTEEITSLISLLSKFQGDFEEYFSNDSVTGKIKSLYKKKIKLSLTEKDIEDIEKKFNQISSNDKIFDLLHVNKPIQFQDISDLSKNLVYLKNCLTNLNSEFGQGLTEFSIPASFSDFNYRQIQWFIDQYENLRMPVVGYLFRGKQIEELNKKFVKTFKAENLKFPRWFVWEFQKFIRALKEIKSIIDNINKHKENLPDALESIDYTELLTALIQDNLLRDDLLDLCDLVEKFNSNINTLQKEEWFELLSPPAIKELKNIEIANTTISLYEKYGSIDISGYKRNLNSLEKFINKDSLLKELDSLKNYLNFLNILNENFEDIKYILSIVDQYPGLADQAKIDKLKIETFKDNNFTTIGDLEYSKFIRFLSLYHKLAKNFFDIPSLNYSGEKNIIEELVTAQMTYLIDNRLINFYENNRSTARTLRDIIRSKRKFPRDEFLKLKDAFPCILAGIRDYAEYIPLEPEIFDLVIIDEASQVSIAQAFPALLRAKKVLILGDKKQFSNVKSAQARSDTNREYLNNLKDVFIKHVSKEETKLIKLGKFNIKTSILEFFEFISNYNSQLLKHFRGYEEIISYSKKYFYQDSLQVMKIRGKAIDDVLRFTFIKHDGKKELALNSNSLEAQHIISELRKLKDTNEKCSIGIITPHTNQQKLLVEMISKLPEKDYFYDVLKLKIMTFDTCQGEERDLIFYSMVATEEEDHLWGVFIKDLNNVDVEEDGKIKAQRLNVGFSRAKECINFVLSKPLDKYNGSVGEALRHYYSVLVEARKERNANETDKKSKMEPLVLTWFYKTNFWNKHKNEAIFIPQFELGKYLRQLDKTYHHPNYKVDFLLVYKDESHKEHKIIIEYDGFKEHFTNFDEANEYNYENYYTDGDVYREKVLESYGYKFLRINKFNVGDDPVQTFNNRLENIVKNGVCRNYRIDHIHETIDNLQNGKMKECPKCKEIRNLSDFKDSNLITSYGRFCNKCKQKYTGTSLWYEHIENRRTNQVIPSNDQLCPVCRSPMVLRAGRFGKFFGCSRFPYCKGTRRAVN